MRNAVVIDAVRTPIGKASSDKGIYRDVRAEDLSAHVIDVLMKRTGIDPHLVDDVRWGCVQQQGEQGFDVARTIALIAGLPIETGGVTINRNCASSLQAINDAAMNVAACCEDVQIAGGVEHMQHIPMETGFDLSPRFQFHHSIATQMMGLTLP
ncbi:MAG TPA: acetyl-CoA C-acyltransferase, partial [Planctomycetaceae bacterium]|nr:acetyl-CoA C-acyltransferase [Planctomycetaceae bacterium]